jgi:hypothetical protein
MQNLLVLVLVAGAALSVARRYLPRGLWLAPVRLLRWLSAQVGWSGLSDRLARRLASVEVTAAGCGGGCSGCAAAAPGVPSARDDRLCADPVAVPGARAVIAIRPLRPGERL